MTLKERLTEDMKTAMRAREEGRERLSVIRIALAEVKNAEVDKRRELTDEEVLAVLNREVRQRQEALAEAERGGREDVVRKLQRETEILRVYLPEPLGEAELERLVREAIEAVGAAGPSDLGKVMGRLMPQVKGRADGKALNELVRRLLS
ncbi:MAG: GatB/YqeY domain-containing protein [Thermaerobacter sp.]|jgi:hypothetical protein|nr:GatB/YqeY domain-containing protein [Thermaerobacter sp.]MDA8144990.1 GatB/YqeY domain-containing protein [Thermaerobacter sp.]